MIMYTQDRHSRPIGPELKVHITANFVPEFKKPIDLEFHPVGEIGQKALATAKTHANEAINENTDAFIDLVLEFQSAQKNIKLENWNAKKAAQNYYILRELQTIHPSDDGYYFDLEFNS